MAASKQDLAPTGGYKDIQFKRVLRKPASGWKVFGALVGIHAYGLLSWSYWKKQKALQTLETFDSRLALLPFYTAEDDRYQLKQYRAWREFEADLMKNEPGWETGKYKGEKLYHRDGNHFNAQFKKEVEALSYFAPWDIITAGYYKVTKKAE